MEEDRKIKLALCVAIAVLIAVFGIREYQRNKQFQQLQNTVAQQMRQAEQEKPKETVVIDDYRFPKDTNPLAILWIAAMREPRMREVLEKFPNQELKDIDGKVFQPTKR